MKRWRLSLLTFLWMILALGVAVGAVQSTPGPLLGQWQCEFLGETMSLVFQSDTRLIFDGEPAAYTHSPGQLLVNDGFETVRYGYSLQGDQMILDVGEGFQMSCARVGGPAESPPRPQGTEPREGRLEGWTAPSPTPPREEQPTASSQVSGDEVGEASWGFRFKAPQGWTWKADYSGAVLGHNSIPGMILVIPHQETSLVGVNQQLQQGLREDDLTLSPSGQISQKGSGVLSCEITGTAEAQPVKGRAYGTLSPYGGGAYVVALTTPEKYGEGVAEAADVISSSMSYFKVEVSDLFRHFSGMWAYYSGGSGGGTLVNYDFYPDGTFEDTSETSYNINYSSDGWNMPDTNIGATGRDSSKARWSVRGTLEAGQITITYPNGNTRQIDYRMFEENGRKYLRECVFNGRRFSKRKDY